MSDILSPAEVVAGLLKIKAIQLSPKNPFTFASGIKSPIYCDGRLVISEPQLRNQIAQTFAVKIKQEFPQVEVISGVATGSIAMSAWVADKMQLPMIYARKPKGYGHNKTFEGRLEPGNKVVVIEDSVSTGGSCIEAVNELKAKGADVLGVFLLYSHELAASKINFEKQNLKNIELCGFADLLQYIRDKELMTTQELEILHIWHEFPQDWIGRIAE